MFINQLIKKAHPTISTVPNSNYTRTGIWSLEHGQTVKLTPFQEVESAEAKLRPNRTWRCRRSAWGDPELVFSSSWENQSNWRESRKSGGFQGRIRADEEESEKSFSVINNEENSMNVEDVDIQSVDMLQRWSSNLYIVCSTHVVAWGVM